MYIYKNCGDCINDNIFPLKTLFSLETKLFKFEKYIYLDVGLVLGIFLFQYET